MYGHPDERLYLRRIVNETGLAIGQVQRELKVLCGAGVISRSEEEGRVYFQANERCPIHQELRALVRKSMGAAAALGEALRPLASKVHAAFVFGSISRGEETRGSDVDLMVVGDVSFAEVSEAIKKAEQRIGREVILVVYPLEELNAKAHAGHHFILQVLRGEEVFLAGGERELGAVLEEPVDS
jgi:uncharacterized protein